MMTARLCLAAGLACLLTWGCDTIAPGDSCHITNSDCFQCLMGEVRTCSDLRTMDICRPVYLNGPCEYGSTCDFDSETCPDVCIYSGFSTYRDEHGVRCGTEGLTFGGAGGLAVGYVRDPVSLAERPAALLGDAHGSEWSYVEAPASRSGCSSERLTQLEVTDPETGYALSVGTGPSCPPGIYRTTDGGVGWRWLPLPAELAAAAGPEARLAAAAGVPGWLFLTGPAPALSRDGGETWKALPLPVVDPGDGTPIPTAVAHATPGWGADRMICVSTAGAPAELQCGTTDGTAMDTLHRFDGPILGFGWPPFSLSFGWIVTGGREATFYEVHGAVDLEPSLSQPEDPTDLVAVQASLIAPDVLALSFLHPDRLCSQGFLAGASNQRTGIAQRNCLDLSGPGAVFGQALGRVFAVGPALPGAAAPWVRATVDGYPGYVELVVSDAPAAEVATVGIAVGLTGPVTPPWSSP